MPKSRPHPPQPDRRRSIRGSFSWIDHRFLREGFDQGLTRLEKLLYFALVAVGNQDGVSFYSDTRLAELLDIRFPHELDGARKELVARDLILKSGVKFPLFMQICPKTGIRSQNLRSSSSNFTKVSFSLPAALTGELDARLSLPWWQ